MAIVIEIKGTDEVMRNLENMVLHLPGVCARALNAVAETTMTNAKERTPVDTGNLRKSGHVSRHASPKDLAATLSFGTEYALFVHEIPPPPDKSVGGRSARHKVGEWKYLEKAVAKASITFLQDINDGIARDLERL